MEDDQQFCLRWNNHQSTLVSVFDTLLEKGIHVDCTLAAEGQTLKAHKVVLSACSPYFESVLSQQYDKHPIIILKDVKYAELRAMMDYMYRGEVNISQDQLAALLKAAESLQIKGLSDNKPSRPPSRPAPTAHPPRAPSPPPKLRDGSIDSREGSVSPTRRRKKARRNSTDVATAPLLPQPTTDSAAGNGDDHCKKEEGMEDLTLDEEHDEPAVTNNDIVRNFQWHMERSQDEIMNSSDSVRDSQDSTRSIVTRSRRVEPVPTATTFAILKPKKITNTQPEETKENKKQPPAVKSPVVSPSDVKPVIVPKVESKVETPPYDKSVGGARVGLTPLKEKCYICQNCHRGYNARRNLVRHVTVECGRVPQYKCPHCEYRQHRRNELRKHIEKKHRNKLPPSPSAAAAIH